MGACGCAESKTERTLEKEAASQYKEELSKETDENKAPTDIMIDQYVKESTAIIDKYNEEYDPDTDNDPNEPSEIIDSFLWVGSAGNARKADNLKNNLGITHILNLCAASFGKIYDEKYGFKVCRIDADDNENFQILSEEITNECFEFMKECKSQKDGKIFVHCVAGCNRSVTIVIAYLIYVMEMDYISAIKHIGSRRIWILTNDSFKRQLIQFAFDHGRLSHDEP